MEDKSAITFCLSLLPQLGKIFNMPFSFFVNTKSHSSVANEGFQVVLLFVIREVAFDCGVCDIPFLKLWSTYIFNSCLLRQRTLHKLINLSRIIFFFFFSSFLWMDFDGIVVWTSGLIAGIDMFICMCRCVYASFLPPWMKCFLKKNKKKNHI